MGGPELVGVGKTALAVALVRAHESRRPDRLFDDPYAAAFVAAAPTAAFPDAFPGRTAAATDPLARMGAAFAVSAVLRTRFFDDYLLRARAAGCAQVVLLAAGLDTRAYRLAWPAGTRVFELDLPAVLDFKERVLHQAAAVARCERIPLPVDLREDWTTPVRAAGLDPSEPTAWLCEGLLIYLSAEEADQLLTTVSDLSVPGSQLAFEHGSTLDPALMAAAHSMPAMKPYTSMWKGGLGHEAPDWLIRHGWSVNIHDGHQLAAAHGRAVSGPAASAFLIATRNNCP
jgi:methyltransferase (TIGR00027 family)